MKRYATATLMVAITMMSASMASAQDDDKTPPAPVITGNSAGKITTSGRVKVELKGGMTLEGSPVDVDALKMASLFGEATIPLHTIAGIRFAQKPTEQSTVVLLNGDALTGEVNLTELKCVAEWGTAAVNVSHIVSVVFRPDLTWSSVPTPNGDRWQLKKTTGTNANGNSTGGNRTYPPGTTFPRNR